MTIDWTLTYNMAWNQPDSIGPLVTADVMEYREVVYCFLDATEVIPSKTLDQPEICAGFQSSAASPLSIARA